MHIAVRVVVNHNVIDQMITVQVEVIDPGIFVIKASLKTFQRF
jgi:hypothetical protein